MDEVDANMAFAPRTDAELHLIRIANERAGQLVELTRENDDLRGRLRETSAERDVLLASLVELKRSKSWRITRPIRAVSELLRRTN